MEQAKEEALYRLGYVSHWAKEKQGFQLDNDLTQFSEGHDTPTDSSRCRPEVYISHVFPPPSSHFFLSLSYYHPLDLYILL